MFRALGWSSPRQTPHTARRLVFTTPRVIGCVGAPPIGVLEAIGERMGEAGDRLLQVAAVGDAMPTVLHEIKNPLAAINAALEVLIEEQAGSPIATELHAVLQEVRRLSLTVDGVGRLGHSLLSTQLAAIDQCCREAFTVLTRMGHDKGLSMRCDVPTLPLLAIDTGGCRALVFNLVMNAIRACSPGQSIALRLEHEPGMLRLVVTDTGAGMAPDVLARCRELFFTTRAGGSGIGLALCQSLAESAKGKLEICSLAGAGTTVTVTVPLNRSPPKEAAGRR